MDWLQLITNKRLGQEHLTARSSDDRTEFKRDYDRLIFSAPFRRLQNKTQVFPLPGSVFVHNRLTHSLEVSSVGMSLGSDVARALVSRRPELASTPVAEIGQIVATACLAHDMGNPPFGHSGEKAIETFFTEGAGLAVRPMVSAGLWSDITHFEGNANTFRLLTHRFQGRREGGFVMTYSTLGAIVKYPHSSQLAGEKGKFGFFATERPYFERIAAEMGVGRLGGRDGGVAYMRHPLVYLVEAADDICYEVMDIEDSFKLRILTFDETADLLLSYFDAATRRHILDRISKGQLTDANERVAYLRARVIGLLVGECVKCFLDHEQEILAGSFSGSLIGGISEQSRTAYERCAGLSAERIYRSKPVVDVELAGYKILYTLLEQMTDAALHPSRYYSRQLFSRVSGQYDITSPDLEARIMAVLDYISGMTDVYALDVYQKISGISLPIV